MWKNYKMFNITSKYFSIFNNKPPASWVAYITRDFRTCYSCSYYSSMIAGTAANQDPTYTITDKKLYIPVVTLSTQDNVKLLKQLESVFKRTINWNKYHSEITTYNDFLFYHFKIGMFEKNTSNIFFQLWK